MTIDSLLSQLNYPDHIKDTVRGEIEINEKAVATLAQTAYLGDSFDFPLCSHTPFMRLTVVSYLLLQKYREYGQRNIPEPIILDTLQDVSLRAERYYGETGKIGITKEDVIWFRHIMSISIFKIGALQFQPFDMLYLDEETIGEPYMTFSQNQKEVLPIGAPVINCHIPYGADISNNAVDYSLAAAKKFFSIYFPSVYYKAFLCYSWLLYPPMVDSLPETSNIKQFAQRFTIIGFCDDAEQAAANLHSGQTSLKRLYRNHPEGFGFGCGLIYIDH